MNQQFTNPFFAFSKQFSDNAFKAHALALKGLESITGLQRKDFEDHTKASSAFVAEAMQIRDVTGIHSLWEKGTSLGRDGVDRTVATSQEVVAIVQKTAQSMAALAQEQRQAVNDAVVSPIAGSKKTAAK